jgi:hypothetical protein
LVEDLVNVPEELWEHDVRDDLECEEDNEGVPVTDSPVVGDDDRRFVDDRVGVAVRDIDNDGYSVNEGVFRCVVLGVLTMDGEALRESVLSGVRLWVWEIEAVSLVVALRESVDVAVVLSPDVAVEDLSSVDEYVDDLVCVGGGVIDVLLWLDREWEVDSDFVEENVSE